MPSYLGQSADPSRIGAPFNGALPHFWWKGSSPRAVIPLEVNAFLGKPAACCHFAIGAARKIERRGTPKTLCFIGGFELHQKCGRARSKAASSPSGWGDNTMFRVAFGSVRHAWTTTYDPSGVARKPSGHNKTERSQNRRGSRAWPPTSVWSRAPAFGIEPVTS